MGAVLFWLVVGARVSPPTTGRTKHETRGAQANGETSMSARKTSRPTDDMFTSIDDKVLASQVEEAGRLARNQYVVNFPNMWAKFPTGNVYRVSLNPSHGFIQSVGDETPAEIMVRLLADADETQVKAIDGEPQNSIVAWFWDYMDVLERVQGAALGKSKRSAGSKKTTAEN